MDTEAQVEAIRDKARKMIVALVREHEHKRPFDLIAAESVRRERDRLISLANPT